MTAARTDSGALESPPSALPRPEWLLINDFAVSKSSEAEVAATYGGQKLPCLLYYTRVLITTSV